MRRMGFYVGIKPLGLTKYHWWRCSDCDTDYPELPSDVQSEFPLVAGDIFCNGEKITKCPFCS